MIKIYVRPIDSNSEYTELDLFENEVVELTQTNKNDEVFDQVFTPFTQEFNVPATEKNKTALIHYFEVTYMKTRKKFLEAVITLNEQVFKKGKVQINTMQFVEKHSNTIGLNFYTSISALKDKIGEDKLTDLTYDTNTFVWNAENVYRNASGQIPHDDIIVPLISNKRAWNYKGGGSGDIYDSNYPITQDELRPALRFSKVMDAIIDKYGLTIDCPLFGRPEYQNLFVYLNNNASEKEFIYPLPVTKAWVHTVNTFGTFDTAGNGIRYSNANMTGTHNMTLVVDLKNVVNVNTGWGWDDDISIELTVMDSANIERVYEFTEWTRQNNNGMTFVITLDPRQFGHTMRFNFKLKSKVPLSIQSFDAGGIMFGYSIGATSAGTSPNNTVPTQQENFDIATSISSMKVTDFLSSFFKMFNIRVLETTSDMYAMKWLTPQDIVDDVIDITNYVDWNTHDVMSPNLYKTIKFTHEESSLFRNVQYKKTAANKEFGSEIYEETESDNTEAYEVETNYQVMNFFQLNGTTLFTSYGWETNGDQYFGQDECIIFYFNGYHIAKDPNFYSTNVFFKYRLSNQQPAVQIAQYAKVSNVDDVSNQSITWDITIDPTTLQPYTKSLFKSYYQDFIENIYGNNSRKFRFDAYLPSHIIDRIKITSTLIIENMRFYVDEIKMDLVTGKSELTLTYLEYKANAVAPYNIYPPNNLFIFSTTYNSIQVGFNGSDVDAPQFITGHTLRYKRTFETVWTYMDVPAPNGNTQSFVPNIAPLYSNAGYNIEVQAYDNLGKVSDWVSVVGVTNQAPSQIQIPPSRIGIGDIREDLVEFIISNPSPYVGVFNIDLINNTTSARVSMRQTIKEPEEQVILVQNSGQGIYSGTIVFETTSGKQVTEISELRVFEN